MSLSPLFWDPIVVSELYLDSQSDISGTLKSWKLNIYSSNFSFSSWNRTRKLRFLFLLSRLLKGNSNSLSPLQFGDIVLSFSVPSRLSFLPLGNDHLQLPVSVIFDLLQSPAFHKRITHRVFKAPCCCLWLWFCLDCPQQYRRREWSDLCIFFFHGRTD